MRMFANITKTKNIEKNKALYKVYAYHSKEYYFYVSIDIKTKIVSFFNDEQQIDVLGNYDLNFPNTEISIQTIPNSVSLLVCRDAGFAIEDQKLPDDISRAVG